VCFKHYSNTSLEVLSKAKETLVKTGLRSRSWRFPVLLNFHVNTYITTNDH
jgi:hypothetical protein